MRYIAILTLLIFSLPSISQPVNGGQSNWWYFGSGASLNFNGLVPNVVNNGQLYSLASPQTISDKNGNLLFYANGNRIYDSSHNLMQNGYLLNLQSYASACQSQYTLVVPKPCDENIYYYFYCDLISLSQTTSRFDLYYAIVDMSANGGLGAVTQKNVLLRQDVRATLDATLHSNNRDYWLVTKDEYTDEYWNYLITDTGLVTTPVVCHAGLPRPIFWNPEAGQLRFSPDGNTLANANYNGTYPNQYNTIELLDFNRSSGQLVPRLEFTIDTAWYGYNWLTFPNVEFSPSGNKLYAIIGAISLVQFDLSLPTNAQISNSGVLIIQQSGTTNPPGMYYQRGPDGKLYSPYNSYALNVINDPDSAGLACNFGAGQLYIGVDVNTGLPGFINTSLVNRSITHNDSCAQNVTTLSLVDTAFVDSTLWTFGDGTSTTTAYQLPMNHQYAAGTYNLMVEVFTGCNIDTVYDTLTIYPEPLAHLGNDTILCEAELLQLTFNDSSFNYLWSTGDTTMGIQILHPDTYTLQVSNVCGIATDTIVVDSLIPALVHLPNDTLLCTDDTLLLDATVEQGSYLWQDNSTDSIFYVTTAGTYTVAANNFCGNSADTITVTYTHAPTINLGADTVLCVGDTIILNATDTLSSYLWYNGDTTALDTITTSGNYWAISTNLCGADTDSIAVHYLQPATAQLGNDTVICLGYTLWLSDTTELGSYQWNTNATTDSIAITTAGTYSLTVTNVCNSVADTIIVATDTIPTINLGNDTLICLGDSVLLDGTFSRSTYQWNTGATDSTITITQEGTYTVTTTNLCGTATDSLYLDVDSILLPNLGNDTILCAGDQLTLSPQTPQAETYQWSTSTVAPTLTITTEDTYTVTVSNVCGNYSDTIMVYYDNTPVTNLGPDSTYCLTTLLTLDATWSRANYLWNTGATDSAIVADTTGQYWVEVTNLCGYDDDTVRIHYVVPIDFELGNDTILCPGTTLQLSAPAHQATYQWNTGSTDSTITVTQAGQYTVTAHNLCGSFTDAILVKYDSIPTAILPNDTTVCAGIKVSIGYTTDNATTIHWSNDETTATNQTLHDSGSYVLSLTNHCGTTQDTITLSYQPYPEVNLGSDTIVCEEPITLYNQSTLDSNSTYSYAWSDGSEKAQLTINLGDEYSLTVTDDLGCSDADVILIEDCGITFFIPNAFSPNGDGLNEIFLPQGSGFDKYHMAIFNRWGEEIFSTTDPTTVWDGTYHGERVDQGVYSYRIWVEAEGYASRHFIGTVTLVR